MGLLGLEIDQRETPRQIMSRLEILVDTCHDRRRLVEALLLGYPVPPLDLTSELIRCDGVPHELFLGGAHLQVLFLLSSDTTEAPPGLGGGLIGCREGMVCVKR